MDERRSSLRLRPAVVRTSNGDLHHLDLVVDGISIQTTMGHEGATTLNRVWMPSAWSPVDVFRGRAVDDLAGPGRLSLLTCSICADLECGALTAALHIGPDQVAWSDFRWVTGYDDDLLLSQLPSPVRFDRAAYERELDQAAVVLETLPAKLLRPPRQRWWRR
ncbi:hypothetical protein TEK04_10860 [Klenkia sp. LSe6-5]|uniref:Uncharacterized protein n=1 Tax=Klenkia sesuvii TaxID=3103137 RepID=A0ABU8DWI4_9ACTN